MTYAPGLGIFSSPFGSAADVTQLQKHTGGYINVQEAPWGAVGDGVTDDYAALNSMVTALGSTQATLVVSGSTVVNTNLTIPSNLPVRFEGSGKFIGTGTVAYVNAERARYYNARFSDSIGAVDWSRLRAQIPNAQLSTPVPYTGTAFVHPDVYFNPNGWNGYRYWMAVTPYPGGDSAYENPSLYVSQDGQTWADAPGITNPLVGNPTVAGSGYNSDPDLVDGLDGNLYLFWRVTNISPSGTSRIYVISSSDGVNWSSPVNTVSPPGTEDIISPAVIYDGKQWVMYYVHCGNTSGTGTKEIQFRTASNPTGPWSGPTAITIAAAPGGKEYWHLDAARVGGQTLLLIMVATADQTGVPGNIYLAWSGDGETFSVGSSPLVTPNSRSGVFTSYFYRSTFAPIRRGNDVGLAIWFTGNGDGVYKLGYAEAWPDVQPGASTPLPARYTDLFGRAHANLIAPNIEDLFNRADSAVTPGSPEIGAAWTVDTGTFGISSRQLYQPTAANSRMYIDAGGADKTVIARFAVCASLESWVILRFVSGTQFLRFGTTGGTSPYRLQTVNGGASDSWISTIGPANGDWVELVMSGSSITVRVNDVTVATITNANYTTATKFGFQMSNSTSRFSAFMVY